MRNLKFRKKINSKSKEKIFIDLKSNSIGWEKFPFSIWSKIMRKVLNSPHENLLKSQPLQGTLELREAICKHLKSADLLCKSLLSHVWQVPGSKGFS